MTGIMRKLTSAFVLMTVLAAAGLAWGDFKFPPPDFTTGYQRAPVTTPAARAHWQELLDVALMTAAMGLSAWIAFRSRRRWMMTALSLASLAYFGFWRAGCICPIGAIQNVAQGIFDPGFTVPISMLAFFVLPLVAALFFGRIFCSGVCWLGAAQDFVLIRPVRLPMWLQRALGVIPWLYLAVSVLLAATGTMYLICRYDPFVPFFRMTGPWTMLAAGAAMLGLSTFVGRPYCRFLCPYGAILGLISRVSFKGVTITPAECINCNQCREACPFGAIEPSNTVKGAPK